MAFHFSILQVTVLILVIISWLLFGLAVARRQRSTPATEHKRDRRSIVGLLVQGTAYYLIGSDLRPLFMPITPLSRPIEILLAVVTVALAAVSVWLTATAVRVLGKEWSITARVLEGHKLATEGPYRLVRHPIYTAMFGMLLATGLAISQARALLPAILILWVGTVIRIRSEEKLLREMFGAEFESYARRVPALFPHVF
ncbi:MAG: isoprenylcysteine carboxylmethyltransferase family protein [Acidobacteria bacterium]|nr:isoprenylcysteine carboxylmethyltransferase family protein [Acidobacteriota bacterium]MBI3658102.1 isoprenylcysteine carboxylmethyltransferase family protein [Acidobacteriota bacterium]